MATAEAKRWSGGTTLFYKIGFQAICIHKLPVPDVAAIPYGEGSKALLGCDSVLINHLHEYE